MRTYIQYCITSTSWGTGSMLLMLFGMTHIHRIYTFTHAYIRYCIISSSWVMENTPLVLCLWRWIWVLWKESSQRGWWFEPVKYIHTYDNAYIHRYIHTYSDVYIYRIYNEDSPSRWHACMRACIHTYIHLNTHTHTHIHQSMHPSIHTYVRTHKQADRHSHAHTHTHTCIHT